VTFRYRLDRNHSRLTAQAFAAGLLSFAAHSPTFAARDLAGELGLDPATAEGGWFRLAVRADSLELLDRVSPADRRDIEGRMRREVLETAAHPEVGFEAEALSARPAGEHEYQLTLDGRLSLHGLTRPHRVEGRLLVYDDGVRLSGAGPLRLGDYDIRPVTALGGAIKLKDQLRLAFDLVAWKEAPAEEVP
jgi:polyisoprenoid-binding protein YceI